MTIVEVEQHNLPRARGRLVRLSYPVYQVHNSFIPLYVSLANHEPSIMYLSISPLQGTSRKHWWWTWLCLPKLEILRNSNLHISMLMCYSLANHEPSTMYLSNYLLQGITWGHRSRGSIGDFLKTTILVLALLKGKVDGNWKIKGREFYLSYHLIYLPCPLALSSCVISNPSLDMALCSCDSFFYLY